MTKKEFIQAILEDMYKKNDAGAQAVNKRWKGWLNRQTVGKLEQIYVYRQIG